MLKYPCYQPFVVSASEPSGREVGRAVGFGERRHPPPRGFVQHFATDILAGASTDQVVRPDGILIDDALPQSWHGSPAFVEAPSARIPSDSWQSRSGGGNSGRWVSPTFPPPDFSPVAISIRRRKLRSVGVPDFPPSSSSQVRASWIILRSPNDVEAGWFGWLPRPW